MSRRIAISPPERLAGWLVTGPLGHFVAGVLDWTELLARYWWSRARGRAMEPWDREDSPA